MNPVTKSICDTFSARGDDAYGREAVTQRQHALQSATLAANETADDQLTVAALLHDIGHIMSHRELPHTTSENLDDGHEAKAYPWLLEHFGPRVADPVRLHVAAKRYLCTIDGGYRDTLSPTSLKSFEDQGGVMSAAERAAFEAEPHFAEAIRLRKWDDRAKDPQLETEPIEAFLPVMERAIAMRY